MSLVSDNTAWLITLNNSPSLRSEFIYPHHFPHPTAGILEHKSGSVFNDNVLSDFSAL